MVAVEGSEPSLKAASITAARYALKLASASQSEVIAVCVVQLPQYIEESTRAILRRELISKGDSTLAQISKIASSDKVAFKSHTLETMGSISSALIEFADQKGVDLIVLGTRPSTASMTKMMLGSVSSGVASNANCPVLVVR
jgi:nucleotide-binding universal stress UspA family protein